MRRPRRPNPRRALWIGVVAGVLGLAGYLGNTVSFTLLLGHPTLGILAATVLVLPLVLIGGPDPAVGVRPVLGGLWRRTWLSIALIALSWLTSQGLHLLLARLGLIPAGTSPGLAELAASRTGLLAVVVAAPFAEELLCRRLIYRHLRALYTRGVALVVSTVIFAAAHCRLDQMVALVPLGVCCCLLYEVWAGSLSAAWWGHAVFNLAALVVPVAWAVLFSAPATLIVTALVTLIVALRTQLPDLVGDTFATTVRASRRPAEQSAWGAPVGR